VLLLALGLRLGALALTPDYRPDHDDRNYDWLAVSVALTGGYPKVEAVDGPRPTAFRPPAYPHALAAVYRATGTARAPGPERWRAARVAQAVLGTLTVALLGLVGRRLAGARAGLVAMALAAPYPPLLLVEGALVSEGLFVALVLAATLAALRHRDAPGGLRWAVLAGALVGLATLTRSNAPVLLLPLGLAVWTGRPRLAPRSLAAPAALVATAALCVLPWSVRNWVVMGEAIPLATQTGPALAGTYNEASRLDRENPWAWRLLRFTPEYRDVYERRRVLRETEMDAITRARVRAYVLDHPESLFGVAWWNGRRMLELEGAERSRMTAGTIGARREHTDAARVAFWLVLALALAGALTPAARRVPPWAWLVPALLVASVLWVNTETPRFRIPADPWLILLAALALGAAWDLVRAPTRASGARAGP
jgi:4-amino-4-deoxy-L-arabinose transferase-like glycosyltransferase